MDHEQFVEYLKTLTPEDREELYSRYIQCRIDVIIHCRDPGEKQFCLSILAENRRVLEAEMLERAK